jgi:uncharacterized protein YkwD
VKKLTACLLAVVVFGSVSTPAQATLSSKAWRHELLVRINHYRVHHGLHKLKIGPKLNDAAHAHSVNMARHHHLTHFSSSGQDWLSRIRAYGYRGDWVGENLGVGKWSPKRMLKAWIHSPPHRANLLNRHYRAIGIGFAKGLWSGSPAYYVTNDFGGP